MGGDVAGLASEARENAAEALTSTPPPEVSIVIVGYNSLPELRECLASVRSADVGLRLEILLVDNASSDGTRDFIRENEPDVRLTANSLNVGYSRAVNQGIAEARAKYVLVLNPDIVVLPGSIERLKSFMDEHTDVAIAGSKLLNPDNTLQHSCRRFYTLPTLVLRRTFLGSILRNSRAVADHLMLDYDHETSREVDWVIGACMMVRRRALDDIGGMDERFFLYFEDVDWCYRAWQSGWKVCYVADSVMKHRHTRDSARPGLSRQSVIHGLSMIHFYEKWGKAVYGLKKYQRMIEGALRLLSDLVAVNSGFALAYLLRSSLRGLLTKPMFGVSVYSSFVPFANLVFILTFAFFGLYSHTVERERSTDLILRILRATVLAGVVLMASTFLASQTVYSRVLVGAFCVLAFVLTALLRLFMRTLHSLLRAGRFDLTRVAVVGTGDTARRLAEKLLARPASGYDLAGLVRAARGGDAGAPRMEPSEAERREGTGGFPVLGSIEELPEIVDRHRIGEVIFADPSVSYDVIADFLLKARKNAVDVKMVSGMTGVLTQRAKVQEFLDVPVVAFEREAMLRAGVVFKGALDGVCAVLVLVLCSPVFALMSVRAARRGEGPALAAIPRAGRGGTTFGMFVPGTGSRRGPLSRFAAGHGLAWTPAVVNVLRGEMSFVGPQPAPPVDLEELDLRQRLRFDARPGITGLAQLSAAEGESSEEELAALDAHYVQSWSLLLDVKILMRWLTQCLTGRAQPPPALDTELRETRANRETRGENLT
jgi:GT2 family glycosyltransferase/lipopolysaccharide/colanic/teichoic acid biosynthesis glycosyltransferase